MPLQTPNAHTAPETSYTVSRNRGKEGLGSNMAHKPMMRRRILFAGLPVAIVEENHRLLCGHYDIERCTADEFSLLGGVELIQPDVVIIDLLHLSSLKTIGRIIESNRSCLVLALTGMPQLSIREAVLAAGGTGVMSRSESALSIARWIDTALFGRPYASRRSPGTETDTGENSLGPSLRLTDSDRLVLDLVAKSYPAYRIASALGLSIGAVRLSLAYLKCQFRVRTQQELRRYAGKQPLISDIP